MRDAIVVNLLREGINKHRARELADHFISLTTPPAQPAPVQEPVMGMLEPIGILMKLEGDKHMKLYAMDEKLDQQPVATHKEWNGVLHKGIIHSEKLITPPAAQRPWVGLDPEEIRKANHHMVDGAYHYSFKQGAEWAEAKLKEKNA